MVFGSILAKSKEKIELITANNQKIVLDSNLKRIGLKIFGIPHTEMRVRSRKILKNIKIKNGMNILDAGCGIGLYDFFLSKYPISICGIDISKNKIKIAKDINEKLKLKNTIFFEGDITDLRFKNNVFESIICSDVLEHVENDKKAVKELARVLKKDGTVVFTFPFINKHNKETMKEFGHFRAGYTKESFGKLIENENLKIKKAKEYTYLFGKIAWFFNDLSFKIPVLAALMFYPLYALTFVDEIIKIGKPNGLLIKVEKV